jgi:uncharacterized protein (DUF433 family)
MARASAWGAGREGVEHLKWQDRIVIDPAVCHGQPVVRGTRTPVTVILGALAGGDTFEDVQRDYQITPEDVRACIAFACNEVAQQTYHPLVT